MFTWCCTKQNVWPVVCKSMWAGNWSVAILSFIILIYYHIIISASFQTWLPLKSASPQPAPPAALSSVRRNTTLFYWYLRKMKSSSRVEMPGSSSLFLEFLTAPAAQAALPSAGGKLGGWGWWGGRQKPCSSFSQGGFPSTDWWKVQWEVKDAVPWPWQCREDALRAVISSALSLWGFSLSNATFNLMLCHAPVSEHKHTSLWWAGWRISRIYVWLLLNFSC